MGLTRRDFARLAGAAGLWTAVLRAFGEEDHGTAPSNLSGPDSLKAHAAAVGRLFGCAVRPERLDLAGELAGASHDPYTRIVVDQTSIVVAENVMKWSSLRPTQDKYAFELPDKLFDFAKHSQQKVRGHNLCWHEQLPSWFASVATKENARALLTEHIQTVAGRYAGRVHSWDVVNEAIHPPDGRADGMRKTPWLELIGPEYVDIAFSAAAKADPQSKLTYNDFDIELDTSEQAAKRGLVLLLVRRLRARGIPIHAVGIQSHLRSDGPQPGAGLVSFIRELAKLDLEVYITEMDVNSHTLPGGPELQDAAVAAVYRDFLDLVLPEPNVKAVLTWGITDAHTWLNESKQPWAQRADGARQHPLPFDDQYGPASAFFAIRGAFDDLRVPKTPQAIPSGTMGASVPPQNR